MPLLAQNASTLRVCFYATRKRLELHRRRLLRAVGNHQE
jgi:hypothetical protein